MTGWVPVFVIVAACSYRIADGYPGGDVSPASEESMQEFTRIAMTSEARDPILMRVNGYWKIPRAAFRA